MTNTIYFEQPLQAKSRSNLLSDLPHNEWVPFEQPHWFSNGFLLKRLSDDSIKMVHYWLVEEKEETISSRYSIALDGVALDGGQADDLEGDGFQVEVYSPKTLDFLVDYANREWLELTVLDFYEGIHFDAYEKFCSNEIPTAFREAVQVYHVKLSDSAQEVSEEELTQLFEKKFLC